MKLPASPDRYDRADQDRLRQALENVLTTDEQRLAGWARPTGTATRTTFDTATITLPQLAERVKALLDDLLGANS
jgi:hypothetical protein